MSIGYHSKEKYCIIFFYLSEVIFSKHINKISKYFIGYFAKSHLFKCIHFQFYGILKSMCWCNVFPCDDVMVSIHLNPLSSSTNHSVSTLNSFYSTQVCQCPSRLWGDSCKVRKYTDDHWWLLCFYIMTSLCFHAPHPQWSHIWFIYSTRGCYVYQKEWSRIERCVS